MIRKLRHWALHYWPYITLLTVELLLVIANFKPGTHLVGWDNIFPELDFKLNLYRDLHAVWQEYRSLGVIDNMAHASNVMLDIQRWVISWFVSTEANRWAYMFLMHLLGGWGMYHLMSRFMLAPSSGERRVASTAHHSPIFASLIAAIFYQYALGVIQQFYLPLEVFIQHFAFLPWLVYYMVRILRTSYRSDYLKLFICSLLATPQAHVPTVFIVFAMATGVITLVDVIQHRLAHWRRILLLGLILFVTNAFWFLPLLYSSVTHAHIVAASKASQMASNDLFYRNVKYGNLTSVLQMKGNVLDYQYLDFKTQGTHFMLHPWLDHVSRPEVQVSIGICMALGLLGLGVSFVSRQKRHTIPITSLFILSFIMLGADVPVVRTVQALLRDHVVLFSTIFRAVFTKFSILMSFGYAVCVGIGIDYLLRRVYRSKKYVYSIFVCTSVALVIYISPALRGHFFYENLGVRIPEPYFKVMEYMRSQSPGGRILILPAPWYWQWWQPRWGTINSGFIWHGLSQPITELAFTPWSDHNENLYWEFDRAINAQDAALFETLMRKYDISWVMYDVSISMENGKKLDRSFFTNFLSTSRSLRTIFEDPQIQLYQNTNRSNTETVYLLDNPPDIGPPTAYNDYDEAYIDVGDYITTPAATSYYPYASLFSYQMPETQSFLVRETDTHIEYVADIPETLRGGYLTLEHLHELNTSGRESEEVPIVIRLGDTPIMLTSSLSESIQSSSIRLDASLHGKLVVSVPKKDTQMLDTADDSEFLNQTTNDACDKTPGGSAQFTKSISDREYSFSFVSKGTQQCIKVPMEFMAGSEGYLIRMTTTNDDTRGLYLNFFDDTQKKSGFDTYLDANGQRTTYSFIKSPQKFDSLGYSLYINNKSEATEEVTNTLHDLRVYRIPYRLLKSMQITQHLPSNAQIRYPLESQHAISRHTVTYDPHSIGPNTYLVLSQGHDEAWLAYRSSHALFPFFGDRLQRHVTVNGWANGWYIEPADSTDVGKTAQIVIIFWPQYLQYLGFAIFAFTILLYLYIQNKRK